MVDAKIVEQFVFIILALFPKLERGKQARKIGQGLLLIY